MVVLVRIVVLVRVIDQFLNQIVNLTVKYAARRSLRELCTRPPRAVDAGGGDSRGSGGVGVGIAVGLTHMLVWW